MPSKKKPKREKLFVAFILRRGQPQIAGMSVGVDEPTARRRFAVERGVSVKDVAVGWTPNVTMDEYSAAMQMQAAFLARNGGV